MAITRFGDFGNFVLKIWVSGISWKMWSSDCYSPLLSIVLQYLLPLDSSLQTSFSTLLQPAQCRPLKALSLQSFFRWYTTLVMLTNVLCVLSRSSRVCLFVTSWTAAHQTPLSMGFSDKNPGVGYCRALLQGIFLTQGSNQTELQSGIKIEIHSSTYFVHECSIAQHVMSPALPGLPLAPPGKPH